MIVIEDARRLSPAEREVLRLGVVAALESGKIAGGIGRQRRCSAFPSGRWAPGGRPTNGTDARPWPCGGCGGCGGPAELISAAERGTVFTAMADYTPDELLIGGPLWTRAAVVELVRMVVGVVMTEQGAGLAGGRVSGDRRAGSGRGCGGGVGRPVWAALGCRPTRPVVGANRDTRRWCG
ncbi:hypothetical protein LWC34_31420 [Kibdelosporangium philippinense]|uniref:Uncharacterized protein n=1 Tax=Kibdelosporangium philippinense TaxID=211113 RepID=A0ABS8ZK04_9PSEU|nr:hypothetical protein [Kibdelosporangium philippinense]MCE7007300.1 hypothetical protein [Kibdelosporangium philippinense]